MRKLQGWLKRTSKILKAIWLLFPTFIFLVLIWQCFWVLPQGKDIIISMLEKKYVAGVFLIALVFYVLITWYTGRILVYRKRELSDILFEHYKSEQGKRDGSQDDVALYLQIIFNMPRLFGFLCFSLIWIAFLRLTPLPELGFTTRVSSGWSYILLAITIVVYIALYRIARIIRKRTIELPHGISSSAAAQQQRKNRLFIAYFIILLLFVAVNFIWQNAWLLVLSIIVLQLIFPFIVVIRRTATDLATLPLMEEGGYHDWLKKEGVKKNFFYWILYHANIPLSEKRFFIWFNIISFIGAFFYFLTIFHFPFSVWLGSFSFVLLAFGVLAGMLGVISIISVANDINLHVFIFLLCVVVGLIPGFEPHEARLTTTTPANTKPFSTRPDLKTYFGNWLSVRATAIDSAVTYPVYFILADGGASRSGYWTAGALSKLQ
ncbi:MAG: hypothetical protein H7Y31_06635, partial [Chitinophagaceae bacterium]|nr:hypothetical protein [Chitinophagaceae bacterium]